MTRRAILFLDAPSELTGVNVLGRMTSSALFRSVGKLWRCPHVTIGALNLNVASIKLELGGGVIESAQCLPLFRHVTTFASQRCLVRIGMTSLARLRGEMILAERARDESFRRRHRHCRDRRKRKRGDHRLDQLVAIGA